MSYLIIPDVHNRIERVERVIATYPDRQVVFLGDYFDSYDDTPEIARRTAEWLRHSIDKGRIHLMGNHDIPYRWKGHYCPGYTPEKGKEVAKVMDVWHWNELRLALLLHKEPLRPLILSHAGFSLTNLYGIQNEADVAPATRFAPAGRLAHLRDLDVKAHLDEIRKQWLPCVETAQRRERGHHWLNQGSRMGERNIGGPFWLDRADMRSPLPGIDQIVGHTIVPRPQRHALPNYATSVRDIWYLDGAGKYAALLDLEDNGVGGLKVTPVWTHGGRAGDPVEI
jgi:hypothetical protein